MHILFASGNVTEGIPNKLKIYINAIYYGDNPNVKTSFNLRQVNILLKKCANHLYFHSEHAGLLQCYTAGFAFYKCLQYYSLASMILGFFFTIFLHVSMLSLITVSLMNNVFFNEILRE